MITLNGKGLGKIMQTVKKSNSADTIITTTYYSLFKRTSCHVIIFYLSNVDELK